MIRFFLLTLAVLWLFSGLVYGEKIDFMDYFLQDKSISGEYTISGNQTHIINADPELENPKGIKIIVYSKFNSPDFYEVFRLAGDNLFIRYEVFRNPGGKDSWVRIFENAGGFGPLDKLGYLWSKRYIDPDAQKGWEYESKVKRFFFDFETKEYEYDEAGSSTEGYKQYTYPTWGQVSNAGNNATGEKISKVLRLVSEWQPLGIIYETYDYAKGLGLVDWCWYELVSSFVKTPEDNIYKYSIGYVYVSSFGDENNVPEIYNYDMEKKEKLQKLQVVKHKSHWDKEGKERWYIKARCLSDEAKIEKLPTKITPDFGLPEWGEHKTLKDLKTIKTP